MALNLSFEQQKLLNDVSKYEPAWRNYANLNGGEGFGDTMRSMVQEFDILRDEIDTNVIGIKELEIINTSISPIILFENQEIFISDIIIKILQPFNNSAIISIGTDLDNELLFSSIESDLNEVMEFITFPKLKISNTIKLFFNSGGSGSGQAKIIINLE